jgi:hypothetical protein
VVKKKSPARPGSLLADIFQFSSSGSVL